MEVFRQHSSQANLSITTKLEKFHAHTITSVIIQVLHQYEPLLSYTVSQELIERKDCTTEAIAMEFGNIRKTNREVLRVLLSHLNHLALLKSIKQLTQLVGIHIVRPSEDRLYLNQRKILMKREHISNLLIEHAATWNYSSSPTHRLSTKSVAKALPFLLTIQWPVNRFKSMDDLQACFKKYGSITSFEGDFTQNKAKLCLCIKSVKSLDHIVTKLQTKSGIIVLHMILLPDSSSTDQPDISSSVAKIEQPSVQVLPSLPHENSPKSNAARVPTEIQCHQIDNFTQTQASFHKAVASQTSAIALSSSGTQSDSLGMVEASTDIDIVATSDTEAKYEILHKKLQNLLIVLQATTPRDQSQSDPVSLALQQLQTQIQLMVEGLLSDSDLNASFDAKVGQLLSSHHRAKTKVMEAEILASKELLRIQKARYESHEKEWEVEMAAMKLISIEAEQQNSELRHQLQQTRSELACQLAAVTHLKRNNTSLQEKLLIAEKQCKTLEEDFTSQKVELLSLQDVAAKAQIRVEAYKSRNANVALSNQEEAQSKPAVDELASMKEAMNQHLQSQIDATRAAIEAMTQKDTATLHLSHQEKTLAMLVNQLDETQKEHAKYSTEAMQEARYKLQQLYHSNPSQEIPSSKIYALTNELQSTIQTHERRITKRTTNSDSLNIAKLSLQRFQDTLNRVSY
ncbi:hypothetical protein THRCLA_05539 [Thraustotheca clavata]|uniref:Rho-GAP domain-containing protein n=1 Tax=Thraustotheca clavata TaxID=74557 RepID=A0A1V9ZWA0_9STRA|nr:hypothetical protein THRCLA_05539 [Thraustotheca clavata]